jgi:hypothetical protein
LLNDDWQGKPKYSEKTYPSACPDANPGRRGGTPATNRLSYGTATAMGELLYYIMGNNILKKPTCSVQSHLLLAVISDFN